MAKWVMPLATTTERNTLTPDAGELIYDETVNVVYVGDGSTVGGVEVVTGGTLPTGGTAGQVLTKVNSTDFNATWQDVTATVTWGGITGTLSDQTDLQAALNGKVSSVVAGTNVTVDNSDPQNPIVSASGSASVAWGDITGTLSSQTDLQSALDAKADDSHVHDASDITSGTFADARIAQSNVTQHQAALSITESQISDLQAYITASSADTLTNKSGNISQWTNDSGYITSNLTEEQVQDFAWNVLTGTQTLITVTYDDANGEVDFAVEANLSNYTNDAGFLTSAPVDSVNTQTGAVVLDADDISDAATTNKFTTAGDITKLSGIETGADVTDETNVVSSLSGATLTAVTVATDDKVIIQDTSDSDNIKTVTAQSIADLAGGGGGFTPTCFQATKNSTTFTSTTSFVTVTGFDTDVDQGADYTLNSGTGVLTFDTDGTYSISFRAVGGQSANNRNETQVRMQADTGSGFANVAGAFDRQYASRNTTQDEGSAQFNNFLFQADATDEVRFQIAHVGVAAVFGQDDIVISVFKISDVGRT